MATNHKLAWSVGTPWRGQRAQRLQKQFSKLNHFVVGQAWRLDDLFQAMGNHPFTQHISSRPLLGAQHSARSEDRGCMVSALRLAQDWVAETGMWPDILRSEHPCRRKPGRETGANRTGLFPRWSQPGKKTMSKMNYGDTARFRAGKKSCFSEVESLPSFPSWYLVSILNFIQNTYYTTVSNNRADVKQNMIYSPDQLLLWDPWTI